MSSKQLHVFDITVVALAVLLCLIAFIIDDYRSELLAVGSLTLFYFFLQVVVDRFSKKPATGMTCLAVTDLDPEGKIDFAEKAVDARVANGVPVESGQECVIIDFKRGLFTKGIYIVRPVDEKFKS